MTNLLELTPGQLYQRTNLDALNFITTDDLGDFPEIIGQPRAVEAVRFAVDMDKDGYNIFALGPGGAGKQSLVTRFFERKANQEPVPDDWIYVQNFEQEHRPNAIRLPAGMGIAFQKDMAQLVEELRTTLVAAFESEEYRTRRQVIEQEIQDRQEKAFEELQLLAKEHNLALLKTPGGLVFAPVKDGEVMPPEEFNKLPAEVRADMEKSVVELQEQLQKVLLQVPGWQREVHQRIRVLNQDMTTYAVTGLLNELRDKYANVPEIPSFLDAVQKDVVENAFSFLSTEEPAGEPSQPSLAMLASRARQETSSLRRYQVNLLVDHQSSKGAPVIYEDNPTYQNLLGRVENIAQMGALITDYTLIKSGALHRANGGYLILDARKILQQPYAWEALKRSLESRQIRIESPGQLLGLMGTISLEPEPIDLDVKVALLGDRMLYYQLLELDPEFSELFKVQADFEDQMPRTKENQALYAQVIATLARKEKLRSFDRDAVARVIEHGARLISDSEKITIQFKDITNLLREADHWAGSVGNQVVQQSDVQKAIDSQIYRADRLQERYLENILRDKIMISTEGTKIGQINGLSIIQLGDFSFGFPSRITARVRRGKGDVVNIEREVDLSGPIHSKGVLILAGFLGARYASDQPLSLSASLVFEQSYSGVEGDSASSAELYVLLSAIAEVPIKQSLAVTGSVNQHGQVQAIGGVNEKVEGFFDTCKARGLTGEHGVLIPDSNVKNLMLRQDVIDAVTNGYFHIYPIAEIDQGIELLAGMPAGIPDTDGAYPPDTINGRVQARLAKLAEKEEEGQLGSAKEDA